MNLNSAINWNYVVLLWKHFQWFNFISNLNAEFSCWKYYQKFYVRILEKLLMSESFNYRKRVGNCFSTTCSISTNEITICVDCLISHVLNREEVFDSFFLKYLDHSRVFDEVCEMFLLFSLRLRFFRVHVGSWRDDISCHHFGIKEEVK